MAKKKDFKNPTMAFISKESIEAVEGNSTASTDPIKESPKEDIPKGFKANPQYIETKSKRVQLLIKPSTHKGLQAIAKQSKTSTNDIINIALEDYLERNK